MKPQYPCTKCVKLAAPHASTGERLLGLGRTTGTARPGVRGGVVVVEHRLRGLAVVARRVAAGMRPDMPGIVLAASAD